MKNLLLILITMLALASCAKPTTHYPTIGQDEINREARKHQELSEQEELEQKQKDLKLKLEHQETLTRVADRIMQAGQKICSQMLNQKGCLYSFKIKEEKSINAYADGNKIYVTLGMLDFVNNDEDLALILGHEYAHNLLGHISSRRTNSLVGSLLGGALDIGAAVLGVNTGAGFSKLGGQIGGYSYSKEFEREADYVGLYIMANANYNIQNTPNMWRRMSIKNKKSIYTATTHPTNPERYLSLKKIIDEINYKKRKGLPLLPEIKPEEKS